MAVQSSIRDCVRKCLLIDMDSDKVIQDAGHPFRYFHLFLFRQLILIWYICYLGHHSARGCFAAAGHFSYQYWREKWRSNIHVYYDMRLKTVSDMKHQVWPGLNMFQARSLSSWVKPMSVFWFITRWVEALGTSLADYTFREWPTALVPYGMPYGTSYMTRRRMTHDITLFN